MTITPADLEALIKAGPPGGTTTTHNPIGNFPTDYIASQPPLGGIGPPAPVALQYFEGDDWQPATLPPEQIARMQQKLITAGLIPKGASYRIGTWDDTTRNAYRQTLEYANATGMTDRVALDSLASHPAHQATVPKAYLKPDIASVAQTVKATVAQRLGRDATPEEVRQLSEVMLGLGRKAYNADVARGDSTGTAVDPGAEFAQHLEQTYKPEIARQDGVVDMAKSGGLLDGIFGDLVGMAQGSGTQ